MSRPIRHSPRLVRLDVDGIRLFENGGEVSVEMSSGLTAFVGANGIGKSTLLTLANFAITGLVPRPSAKYQSVQEFPNDSAGFAAEYFSGRVFETDRSLASIAATFYLGARLFRVQRGLFDGSIVQSLQLDGTEVDVSEAPSIAVTLTDAYKTASLEASGFATFEQFSFWQWFVMTFDERRHLLFWDPRTLQSTLSIALGRSPQDAVEAERLQRSMERLDSLARNAKWRATQASNERTKLLGPAGGLLTDEEVVSLREQYDDLQTTNDLLRAQQDAAQTAIRDASRQVAELALEESQLEQAYLEEFAAPRTAPVHHPLLVDLKGGRCGLCGREGVGVPSHVTELLEHGLCPLCEQETEPGEDFEERRSALLEIDGSLARARHALHEARARYGRLRDEAEVALARLNQSNEELREFTQTNRHALQQPVHARDQQIAQLEDEIARANRDAENFRAQRDEERTKLDPIIRALAQSYDEIESEFVPRFRRLAERFIGRDVNIEFVHRGVNLGLNFILDGQSRRGTQELSESQQFFLDIALRMSLVQTFITESSTLIVDTPEGSLDVAYELRAGQLFALFRDEGHAILMMSNLNSSNLLQRLAELSDPSNMKIVRMLEWAELSSVQMESLPLFVKLYDELEDLLQVDPAA